MARLPRLNLPGLPPHIIQRGNNKHICFFSEQDYIIYLSKLNEYSQKYNVAVHSDILMTNHVHLLLTPEESDGVSLLIQSLGRYDVRYVNQTHMWVISPINVGCGRPLTIIQIRSSLMYLAVEKRPFSRNGKHGLTLLVFLATTLMTGVLMSDTERKGMILLLDY